MTKIKIERISEIIPMINDQGMNVKAVATFLGRSEMTLWRWIKLLRAAGYVIATPKRGEHNRLKL